MLDAVPSTPPALTGVLAAQAVVRRYHAAVTARRYRAAYAIWGGHQSYPAFVRGYAHTRETAVRFLGATPVDVAMGSAYTELKVAVTATLDSGHIQHFTGTYTMRRVNDVDGSTVAQRHWHVEDAKFTPAA